MTTSNGIRNVSTPGNMNGTESGALNLTGKPIGPWAQLSSANKSQGIGHGLGQHMQQHQSQQPMPLSPPLTPLPPNLARFPPSPVLPTQALNNPAANLQQLILAAQCNPFLKAPAPGMPPFSAPPEMMENLQKFLQLRQQQQQLLNIDLQKSDNKESDWVETDDENDTNHKLPSVESSPLSNSNNNNNNNKSTFAERSCKSDEELKREEEMLEDEMKEEEDDSSEDEKKQLDLAESLRAAVMKKLFEDYTSKSAGAKQILSNVLPQMDLMSNHDGRALGTMAFNAGEIPCKFNCGTTFSSVLELFQHQDGHCTKPVMPNDESEKDNVVTDDDMISENGDSQDDLNTSGNNSSVGGGERKVRVRTLISDEQLLILRRFYIVNPRPKREELEKVAAQIGHPFKVVKVWFQNSRARDRREGKPLVNQPHVHGHPSPSQTHASAAAASPSSSLSMLLNGNSNPHAFPFLNNNFPQVSNAALLTAAAGLLQNTRLPFISPNSPLFAGANLEQPFDTTNKCNEVGEDHQVSSEEGEKGGSIIEEGSDDEFQASRALDSPQPLHNHLHPRSLSLTERSNKSIIAEEREKADIANVNTSQQPLDLSNKGLSSSSSSPPNSPLSTSMKDTDEKEEKGEEEEVILNLSSNGLKGASSFPIPTHSSSIEDSTVTQVGKTTTKRPLSQQRISSTPSESNQPSPQSTGKSPFPCLSAQGSGFTTQASSNVLGLSAKQSSNLPMDVYRFGEEVCLDNDTVGKVGGEKFDEEGNYSCEKCSKTFTKRSSLSRHKYEHSGKGIYI